MKVYSAMLKFTERKRVFVRAKDAKSAQRAITDKVTMKKVVNVDLEIDYGDVREEKDSKYPAAKKKVVKKVASKKK